LPILLSLSLPSFASRPRGGKKICIASPSLKPRRSWQIFLLVVFQLDSRERRSPRLSPCQNPLHLLCFRPPTPMPTPNGWTPSLLALSPDPTLQRPHACPGHRHGHREHQIKAEHHRPSPKPSLRRQPRDDPLDQFPELVWPEPYRAAHPDRARPMPPCRSECAARAIRPRALAPRLAPFFMHTCMAPCCLRDATLALHRRAPTCPYHAPFCLQRY
jgi:hypothetical protein